MSLKEKIFSNIGWKVVAILLAMALWFHIATEKTYEKRYPARIEAIALSPNLELETIEPTQTEVSVVGTGKQLLQLSIGGGMTAYLDLSLITRPGEYEFDLGVSDLYDLDVSALRSVSFTKGNHFRVAVRARA